jgi:hypothetical protein
VFLSLFSDNHLKMFEYMTSWCHSRLKCGVLLKYYYSYFRMAQSSSLFTTMILCRWHQESVKKLKQNQIERLCSHQCLNSKWLRIFSTNIMEYLLWKLIFLFRTSRWCSFIWDEIHRFLPLLRDCQSMFLWTALYIFALICYEDIVCAITSSVNVTC